MRKFTLQELRMHTLMPVVRDSIYKIIIELPPQVSRRSFGEANHLEKVVIQAKLTASGLQHLEAQGC